jgi:hypothetical protein
LNIDLVSLNRCYKKPVKRMNIVIESLNLK